jgi:aminopeptidase N
LFASQERFFSDRQLLGTVQQTWTIPACYRVLGVDDHKECFLLSSRGQEQDVDQSPIFANGDGSGYYRTEYDQRLRDELTKELETGLHPAERIAMLGDEWALVRVGRLSIGNYLDVASQLKHERQRQVWGVVLTNLEYINDELIDEQDREHFRQFVRNLLAPVYRELKNASDPEQKALDGDLFAVLGVVGRDQQVMQEATQIATKALQDPGSVDPMLARNALPIATIQGDESLFNELVRKLKTTSDQLLRDRYMDALTHFERPELVEKALEVGVSGAIRNQDSTAYISRFLQNPATRGIAWKFVQTHWNQVEKTFTTSSGSYLVSGTGQFCDESAASNVSAFFKIHPVPASERALRQAVERINACVDLKKLQQTNLQSWLNDHSSSQTAAGGH